MNCTLSILDFKTNQWDFEIHSNVYDDFSDGSMAVFKVAGAKDYTLELNYLSDREVFSIRNSIDKFVNLKRKIMKFDVSEKGYKNYFKMSYKSYRVTQKDHSTTLKIIGKEYASPLKKGFN